jgi:uncharacterized protein (TIGR03643 family)
MISKKIPAQPTRQVPTQAQIPFGATEGDVSAVIQMAWEDRTTFETIYERVGLTEPEVIRLMRSELKPSSFRMWRTRMKGRATKHRALRSPDMKFDDRAIADHRRGNF